MPINRAADYYLDGKPFMLERQGNWKGRAWRRGGEISVPGFQTTRTEQGVENFPDQIEFAEVWDDWSGGAFESYRTSERPNTYHWGQNCDTRFPHQLTHALRLIPAGTQTYNSQTEALLDVPSPTGADIGRLGAGAVLAIGRGYFARYRPTNGEAVGITLEQGTPGANYGHRPVTFGSYTYIPVLTGTHFQRRDFAGALVNSDAHGMTAKGFAVAGNRLWRYHGPTVDRAIYLQSTTVASPTGTGNWSATLSIGDSASDITDMISLNDQLYVGSAEGLFVGDSSGTFFNVMGGLSHIRNIDNCRDLSVFDGKVIAPHIAGLFEYYPSPTNAVLREIGFAGRMSNRSPIKGYVRCAKALGPWLYTGLWTGSQSWVVAGRPNGQQYDWHPMQLLPNAARVHRLHFDGVTKQSDGTLPIPTRMWVATDATYAADNVGTAPLYFFDIPMNYDNFMTGSGPAILAETLGSMRIDFGATDRGAPAVSKLYRKVEVWADGLVSGGIYADVYYTLDQRTRTLLGRAQTSPVSHLYFPAVAGSFALGRQIQMSVESFTFSLTSTPVYRSVILRGAIQADVVPVIHAQTSVADGIRDRSGQEMRPGQTQIEELRSMADPSYGPVMLTDLLGATSVVRVLPPLEESEVYQQGDENPQVSVGVRMAVLSFTGA